MAADWPETDGTLPETPHDVALDRAKIDDLLSRLREGGPVDLLEETLAAVDWGHFAGPDGAALAPLERSALVAYYRAKWADIGPLYLAELLSTEFMTEQRARGDIVFSPRLIELGRNEPDLWAEIRQFFRRKEAVTGLLLLAHRPPSGATDDGSAGS
jgi:hypothetical protein